MRKVIQLAVKPASDTEFSSHGAALYALCDDGTMWVQWDRNNWWERVEGVPPEAPNAD